MSDVSNAVQISLFSTLAVKKALDDILLDAFREKTGITVDGTFDPTNVLTGRVKDGARPDVMIAVSGSFAQLAEAFDLGTRTVVAKTGVGLAVAPGHELPDIGTVDALVATLTSARSVAYSRTGASGVHFAALVRELGIDEQVNARATVVEKGFTALAVVDGRADVAIQQLSELRFVPEARIAGPLPAETQHYSEFSAVLGRPAKPEAAELVRFLTSEAAVEAYLETGLEVAP
ncbi:molybdate ABC transporter periplasmic molybdate-binding protein [Amycolatopsis sp. YIM 10]|nr:molybdate ABC transporter periplasmic molybdate-binding protein [Amycolatopsis sp. YIM 10]